MGGSARVGQRRVQNFRRRCGDIVGAPVRLYRGVDRRHRAEQSPSAVAIRHVNGGSISHALGVAIVAAAAAQGTLFAVILARTVILFPFSDMISWIDYYDQAHQQSGGFLVYLWRPHNEHHMMTIRLLTALDVSTFRASGVPFIVAATTSLVVTAALIFNELRRDKCLNGPLRPLALLGPMLLLTSAAALDCSIPINAVYPLTLIFVVGALVLFDGVGETAPSNARRIAALAVAMMASLSNGVGLVVWVPLWWVAWRGGAGLRWLLAIAAVGAGYGFIYVWTLPSIQFGDPDQFTTLVHLAKIAEYLLAYLGLPLSCAEALRLPALALGGILLVAGCSVTLRLVFRRSTTRSQRFAIGLVMASLAAALLAAIGRVDQETEVRTSLRYALLVAPLHIGLLVLALRFLANRATTPRRQAVLLGGALAFAGALLTLQVAIGRSATTNVANILRMIDSYNAGIREPGMEKLIYPDLAVADRVLATLRTSGRY
jgi:hypothetical protein